MRTETVTLDIPVDVLRQAERIAWQRQVTLADLMAEILADIVRQATDYEAARRQHQALLAQGFELGTYGRPPTTRPELHERKVMQIHARPATQTWDQASSISR